MPVLADFDYPQSAKFALQRQQVTAFAIGWQPDAFTIAFGQYTILEEVSFGGYQVHVRFKDWVWNWDNRGYTLDEPFEDFYATAPMSSVPINCGFVRVEYQLDPTFIMPFLTISVLSPVPHYLIQRFPPATRPYWSTPHDSLPATPFWYP